MFDLIVIGAGPAGSMAARQAAQFGLKTLLLDKNQFPRAKPCGGGLTLRALDVLASVGLQLPDSVVERPLMGARITVSGRSVKVRKPWPVAVTVLRERFDSLLLQAAAAAGAQVELGRQVDAVVQDRSLVAVTAGREMWSTRLAVIAEGATGRLKRAVRSASGDRFWFCVSTDSTLSGQVDDHDLMHIETGLTRTGYAWIFPRRHSASVGLSAMPDHCRAPRRIMAGYLAGHGFDADLPLRGHLVPLGGLKRRLAAGRVLLAGDAGGFADAFTCEGIAYALHSGLNAGHAAAKALAHGVQDEKKGASGELERIYTDLCRPLLRQLRHSLLTLRIHDLLPASLYQAILLDPDCLSAFLDVAAAKRDYPSFLAYIARRLPRLALKALRGA